jgi:hypothetical protein
VGQIIAGILGVAWSLLTFLVVPVIVVERKGPVEAFKRSASMLRKTWGEQLIGNFSFGLLFFVLMIPGIAALVAGGVMLAKGTAVAGVLLIGLGIIYMLVLGLVEAALAQVFRAALYMYAAWQEAPAGFDGQLLGGAMQVRG